MAVDFSLNAAGVVLNSGATITIPATISGPVVVVVHVEDTGSVAPTGVQWSLGGGEDLDVLTGLSSDAQAADSKVQTFEIQAPTTGAGNMVVQLSGTPTTMARAYILNATEAFAAGTAVIDTQTGSANEATNFEDPVDAVEYEDDSCVLIVLTWHAAVGNLASTGFTVLVNGSAQAGCLKQAFASGGVTVHNVTWTNGRRYVAQMIPLNPVPAGPGQPSIDDILPGSDDETFTAAVTPGAGATSHTLHRSYSDPDFTPGGGNQIGGSLGASITEVEDTTVDPANAQAHYKLRATDAGGSTDSPVFTYLVPPAVPTSVTATASGDAIDVEWVDNARVGSIGMIWRSAAGGPLAPLESVLLADEAYTDHAVAEGVVYTYRMTAFIGDGSHDDEHSAFSNAASESLEDVIRLVQNPAGEVVITTGTTAQQVVNIDASTLAAVVPVSIEKLTTIAVVTGVVWDPDSGPAQPFELARAKTTEHPNLDTRAEQWWLPLPTPGPGLLTVTFDIAPGRGTAIVLECNRAIQLLTTRETSSSSPVAATGYGPGLAFPAGRDAVAIHNEVVEGPVTGLALGAGESLLNNQSGGNTGRWVGYQTYPDGLGGGGSDELSASWSEPRHLAGVVAMYAVAEGAAEADFVPQIMGFI